MTLILPDTSLCAIVRDEVMNPAGGIVDFIQSTVPFVEQAVIVDTGSVDGTRELLEEQESKYENLKIYDKQFIDFASSRNFSLSKVQTKRALVLDADERLTKGDFGVLSKILRESSSVIGFNFQAKWLVPDGEHEKSGCHNPRLFVVSEETRYKNHQDYPNCAEYLFFKDYRMDSLPFLIERISVVIKHFCPNWEGMRKKSHSWYKDIVFPGLSIPPSKSKNFQFWKKYNPKRDDYR